MVSYDFLCPVLSLLGASEHPTICMLPMEAAMLGPRDAHSGHSLLDQERTYDQAWLIICFLENLRNEAENKRTVFSF